VAAVLLEYHLLAVDLVVHLQWVDSVADMVVHLQSVDSVADLVVACQLAVRSAAVLVVEPHLWVCYVHWKQLAHQ
jgi:hypothetical protein